MTATVFKERPKDFQGIQLSVSKIKTYKKCPENYRYEYVERLPKKDTAFTVFGNFCHEVLEEFHLRLMKNASLSDNEVMTQVFNEIYKNKFKDKLEKKANNGDKDDVNSKQDAYLALKQYLEVRKEKKLANELPDVLAVEEKFYIDIDGKILLIGYIDKIQQDPDGLLHVVDYKTARKPDFLKKDFMQLQTYAYVKFLEDPNLDVVRTSYEMIRLGFSNVEKEFSREKAMKIEDTILEYGDKISKEKLWRATPNFLCNYCNHLDICSAGQSFTNGSRYNKPTSWGESSW